jgi:hypothetical protein
MDPRARALIAAALLGACSASSVPDDRTGPVFDGGPDWGVPLGCEVEPALVLGRCVDSVTSAPCEGNEGELPTFAALEPGSSMPAVVGPQGSTMFVFAARTSGISPGDPTNPASQDNPLVEIVLGRVDGETLSHYRARVVFSADPGGGADQFAPSMFVIVDGSPSSLEGTVMHASAVLEDAEGRLRCGEADMIAAR